MAVLLGSTNATQSGNDSSGGGLLIATKVTAVASGTVDTVSMQIDSTNTVSGTLHLGVYDATGTGGGPGARLGSEATVALGTNGASRYVTSATGVGASVTSGTTYWIASFLAQPVGTVWAWGNLTGNQGAGGTTNGLAFESTGGFATLPATFPTFSTANETINAYAEGASGTNASATAVASPVLANAIRAAVAATSIPHIDAAIVL